MSRSARPFLLWRVNADPGSTHPGMGLSPLPIPMGQAVAGSIIITVSSALVPLRSSLCV